MICTARNVWLLIIAAVAALLLANFESSAQDGRLLAKHQAAGQNCVACHAETPQRKPPAATCVGCHGDQASIAAKTAKADPNPHAPPHLAAGETQVCTDCHSVHKQSEVTCTDCHRGFTFNAK